MTQNKKQKETADLRFKDSLPLQKYRGLTIGIAGLGAVGRQVAILLAAMGHKKLYGADPDKVELKNVGTQGWDRGDIRHHKAHILEHQLTTQDTTFSGFFWEFEKVLPKYLLATDVFFCCVDKMQAREAIWQKVTMEAKTKTAFPTTPLYPKENLQGLWIDARMTTRVMRIITIPLADGAARDYYRQTLFSDTEAFDGSCTDRMTMYGACIAAGLMVSQLANWLNEIPLVRDFIFETQRMSTIPLGLEETRPK